MSCVREASPPIADDHLRHDMKKKRFLQPLRGLRRIFRRKGRPVILTASDTSVDVATTVLRSSEENIIESCEQTIGATELESAKSHSTSHLTDDQIDNSQRRSLQSTLLSVSHDSVFTSEQRSPDSGSETSLYVHSRLGFPQSNVRAELFEAVRRRRIREHSASDDEDLGLPRSPVSNSPTTPDDIFTKENITKSSQSTCSDGSLLSMGSSEIDQESYCHISRHSSTLSLHEKRISTGSDHQHDKSSSNRNNASSLSHSAAKHKMAVRPKRNHGAPHKKRQLITSNTLPTTPEVNEESHKNVVNDTAVVADTDNSDEHKSNSIHVHKSRSDYHHHHYQKQHHTSVTQINSETERLSLQSKCCSLPPGISLSPAPSLKLLTRSKSNVMSSAQLVADTNDSVVVINEVLDKDVAKKEEGGSFFSRLLLRRSSKKRKNAEESDTVADKQHGRNVKNYTPPRSPPPAKEAVSLSYIKEEESLAYANSTSVGNAMKNHPLFRQRVEPSLLHSVAETSPSTRHYSSTVPVNMESSPSSIAAVAGGVDTSHDDDKRPPPVKKSHSFRNRDKFAYVRYEDTPSLPVNIGLEERSYKYLSGECARSRYRTPPSASGDNAANDFDFTAVNCKNETDYETGLKWKQPPPPPRVTECENVSVVNTACKLNIINVNDAKACKEKDAKVPVPAPRISLLGKTSSSTPPPESTKNDDDDWTRIDVADFPVAVAAAAAVSNIVTVTEVADGQKSIISIGVASPTTKTPTVEGDDDDVFVIEKEPSSSSGVDGQNGSTTIVAPEEENLTNDHDGEDTNQKAGYVTSFGRSGSESSMKGENRETIVVESDYNSTDAAADVRTPKPSSSSEDVKSAQHSSTTSAGVQVKSSTKEKSTRVKVTTECSHADCEGVANVKANDTKTTTTTTVVMRKKREIGHTSAKDDEPELMKVFARRSLKLKEPDSMDEILFDNVGTKSRDSSDKENEDSNATIFEDRKKQEEPSTKGMLPIKSETAKFQRSISHDVFCKGGGVVSTVLSSNVNERRPRCKSTNDADKSIEKTLSNSNDEGKTQIIEKAATAAELNDEKTLTPFKRIQQRREEWEKRAQQAMKIHGTK